MIKHIVFWKFADLADGHSKAENIERVEKSLLALKDSIPELLEIEVGHDFNGSPAAFDLSLYTVFASKEDLDTYQVHPEHEKVKALVGAVTSDRGVVDYEV
ncbi:Dabb family protein [Puniceicoccus vermicola]|uniref:Dabb family protein n=1 Tax=Puniceicoccus vermicola TaxID=388746 RepID=A0A7X1B0W6_9BACT|nr:Dabb family protein [Puniceicoccus vermicola]MBC2602473.1 Dabb family protein [Puniceicoccus vermicola]